MKSDATVYPDHQKTKRLQKREFGQEDKQGQKFQRVIERNIFQLQHAARRENMAEHEQRDKKPRIICVASQALRCRV